LANANGSQAEAARGNTGDYIVFVTADIAAISCESSFWIGLFPEKKKIGLDKAAFAYALSGMALNDSWISCWKTRYEYNLLRPVTFIRNVMGHSDWLPLLSTPPHPEYTSGFAAMAGAVCESLAIVFGNNYKITDHSYDYLGMNPRSYSSFDSMAEEAGNSKFYGGIHYKLSVDVGLKQGKAVAKNIEEILFNGTASAKLSAKTP